MPADVQTLLRQIAELPPNELQHLRQQIDVMLGETPEQALSRELRERGLVRAPRMPRNSAESIDPPPAIVSGESVSETLIRERR